MAVISFPTSIKSISCHLNLVSPGQLVQKAEYTGRTDVLSRGDAYFGGTLVIAETDDEGVRRDMEVWLARMRGSENTTDLPIHRKHGGNIAAGTNLSVSSTSISSGVLTINYSGGNLVVGDYFNAGSRLYLVTTVGTGTMTVEPPVVPAARTKINWEDVAVRCRLTDQQENPVGFRLTPDFAGPWELVWEEIV